MTNTTHSAKCIQCKKVKPVFMHCEGATVKGTAGTRRRPGADWCKECWEENVAFNERSRAEQDRKNAQLLKDMLEGK